MMPGGHLDQYEKANSREGFKSDVADAFAECNQLRADLARVTAERDEAWALADQRWKDRRDALNVTSRDGLLSSEWVLRTGQAERERDEAQAENARLRAALECLVNSSCVRGEMHPDLQQAKAALRGEGVPRG